MDYQRKGASVQLGKRLAALSPEQQALFERKVKQKALHLSQQDKIAFQQDRQRFPLSFAQKQLWFLSQLEPESAAYNVPLSLWLKGNLDVPVLEQAFNALLQYQDILRTAFLYDESGEDDEPFQVVASSLTLPLPLIDLQYLPAEEREQAATQLMREAVQQPFDLAVRPLVRLLLLRIQPASHVLLLCMHHILCDGRSLHIAMAGVMAIYTELVQGQASSLPKLPIQYGDYAVWQRNYLQGQTLSDLLRYWVEQMRDVPVLNLPYAHPHRSDALPKADKTRFELSPQTLIAMKAVCREEAVTLFMLLLACFQVLLWHYTRQEKIVVGVSMNNRRQKEVQNLIGLFVNLLPLQTTFLDQSTFRETLQIVRRTCIDGYAHQDLPLEKLIQALPLKRLGSSMPLIQVAFDYQKGVSSLEENTLLQIEPFSDISAEQPRFDLTLRLSETTENILGALEYNRSQFEEATIVQMARQFTLLVDKLAHLPDMVLHEVSLLLA
ncbi:MAG TPA: condensation domain-containing protein [Ktedonobacteraceae bacterium]|nr:condensation domain-containing protein [Ktedonobacteraceae bacterium]